MGLTPWDIYDDDQNPAPAYRMGAQAIIGDTPPPERHYDTSQPMFMEPVDSWQGSAPNSTGANRSPAASPESDFFHESLNPDNRLGEQMAKERYQMGSKNPWDIGSAMQDYSRELGLSAQDFPVASPYVKTIDVKHGPGLMNSGNFGTTKFVSPGIAASDAPGGGPYSLDHAYMEIAPDLTPAEKLVTARHELQHVKEFDQSMHQRGIDGVDPSTSRMLRHGGTDHFVSGNTGDIERSFVKRPYLTR